MQTFYQNYVSSVNCVINFPVNLYSYILATCTLKEVLFTPCFTCVVTYWFCYLLQI